MEPSIEVDAVVVGAGFAGLYMNYRLRDKLGLSTLVFEAGHDVGGTWYWNRYPGARCDSESYIYCYSFDRDLMQEWEWSGKYPEQPEILSYLNHVADRFDLRRNIEFSTRVTSARYDDAAKRWVVTTDKGHTVSTRYFVTAIGCLSNGQIPDIPGRDTFTGEAYHTGSWPHEPVEFSGKKVGVIGTGSSGIQSIPVIAAQAEHLYVFQRSPQYTIPARHGTVDKAFLDAVKADYDAIYEKARWSQGGMPIDPIERSALEFDDDERNAIYEAAWQEGGFRFFRGSFYDISTNLDANATASNFIRAKIRETVKDPAIAEKLVPTDHPFASRRPLIDTDYFDTYNRDNVTLVDLRETPLKEITPTGISTSDQHYELDIIVYATGFDAMTGSFKRMDIRGRNGQSLNDKWAAGPVTYLGLQTAGFPNLFMVTGPGSPSVLTNMPVAIEQHVDWISDTIEHMEREHVTTIEADEQAECEWVAHVNEIASKTLFMQANSWYLGANVPGKPRVFMPYAGGLGRYRKVCDKVAEDGYRGFVLQ